MSDEKFNKLLDNIPLIIVVLAIVIFVIMGFSSLYNKDDIADKLSESKVEKTDALYNSSYELATYIAVGAKRSDGNYTFIYNEDKVKINKCPVCGSNAEVVFHFYNEYYANNIMQGTSSVYCTNDGCKLSTIQYTAETPNLSAANAIIAWNNKIKIKQERSVQ